MPDALCALWGKSVLPIPLGSELRESAQLNRGVAR